jgi:hypothetical protein
MASDVPPALGTGTAAIGAGAWLTPPRQQRRSERRAGEGGSGRDADAGGHGRGEGLVGDVGDLAGQWACVCGGGVGVGMESRASAAIVGGSSAPSMPDRMRAATKLPIDHDAEAAPRDRLRGGRLARGHRRRESGHAARRRSPRPGCPPARRLRLRLRATAALPRAPPAPARAGRAQLQQAESIEDIAGADAFGWLLEAIRDCVEAGRSPTPHRWTPPCSSG